MKRRRSRTTPPPPEASKQQDFGFKVICGLLVVVAAWVLLTPAVPKITETSIRRFHLQSDSFVTWAPQFPIPTMYNFRNTYEVRRWPEDAMDGLPVFIDDNDAVMAFGTANHFPARVITFGHERYLFLKKDNGDGDSRADRWFKIRSTYLRSALTTNVQLRAEQDGTFSYIRLGEPNFSSGKTEILPIQESSRASE